MLSTGFRSLQRAELIGTFAHSPPTFRTLHPCGAPGPVFVDCRRDTLNLDETLLERAITPHPRPSFPPQSCPIATGSMSCVMFSVVCQVLTSRFRICMTMYILTDFLQKIFFLQPYLSWFSRTHFSPIYTITRIPAFQCTSLNPHPACRKLYTNLDHG